MSTIREMWDRVYADRIVDHWRNVDRVVLSLDSPLLRAPDSGAVAGPESPYLKLFGCLVLLNPAMLPNEIKLIASDGSTIRIVNIGE